MEVRPLEPASETQPRREAVDLAGWLIAVGPALVILALQILRIYEFTVDDAFISFRYAKHLGMGEGLLWNIGGDPVEGYTNFLLVLMLGAAYALKLDIVLVSKLMGMLAAVGIVILAASFIRWRFKSNLAAMVVTVLFVLPLDVAAHSVSGMETMLFTFWIVALVTVAWHFALARRGGGQIAAAGLLARRVGRTRIDGILICVLSLLIPLTRPEGALIVGFVLLGIAVLERRAVKELLPALLALTIVPGVIYFLWRWSYFGYPLPNTYYVKAVPGAFIYRPSLSYTLGFIRFTNLHRILIILPLLLLYLAAAWMRRRRSPQDNCARGILLESVRATWTYTLLVVLPALVFSFYYLTVHTDIMGYRHRFLIPVYPLTLLFLAIPFSALESELERIRARASFSGRWTAGLRLLVAFLVVGAISHPIYTWLDEALSLKDYARGLENAHITVGKLLGGSPYRGRLVVLSDAGAIPYYSDWETLDGGALSDEYLAHQGFDLDYFYAFDPDAFVITSFTETGLKYPNQVVYDERFADYAYSGKFFFNEGYWEFVYLRKGDARLDPLRARIAAHQARGWQTCTSIAAEDFQTEMTVDHFPEMVRLKFPVPDPQQGDEIGVRMELGSEPGVCYRFSVEIEDAYGRDGFHGIFLQQVLLEGEPIWEHDLAGRAYQGWTRIERVLRAEARALEFTARVVAHGEPHPTWNWGAAATIGVRALQLVELGECP
jgi:hypothetical protein